VLAAGAAVTSSSLYRELAQVAPPARVVPPPDGYPVGQYQVADYGVLVRTDPESGVPVDIPPVWNLVITATLRRPPSVVGQRRLEAALQAVEAAYPYAPAGIFALVAYGLPYFRRYVPPAIFEAHLPRLVGAKDTPVLLDAVRFPSDPSSLLLEQNEVVFHLRSDVLEQMLDVQRALFGGSGKLRGEVAADANLADLFQVTSVRTGFVGAGLPRRMAEQANFAVAHLIPRTSPLFMGFTSTQQQGQAHELAVRFDGRPDPLLPPLTTARAHDYFAGGTTLHLSHLVEDLESWYALSYEERVARMFHLNATTLPGRITVQTFWLNPNTTVLDAQHQQVIGHNEAVQRGSRTPQGQALQLRADFNTVDAMDSAEPACGVHFLSFSAGTQIFHQSRMGMDAVDVASAYHVARRANGINAFIQATRRQNFLVPPRAHRAFPLLELLPPQ
jgi:hypothetical protein